MDQILDRLFQSLAVFIQFFDDSRIIFLVGVALAIGTLVFSALYLISQATNSQRRRVVAAVNEGGAGNSTSAIERFVGPISPVVLPSSEKEIGEVRKRLRSAGYRRKSSVSVYYFCKLILMLGFALIALYVTTFFPKLSTFKIVLITVSAGGIGSIIPSYILDKRVVERKRRIINAFPDMLDMLVACSEAGLALNAALQRVAREIEPSYPELAEELEIVNAEILAGVDRINALKRLGERTDIPEIQGFISMLSQSLRFGTGIAETLRIYSDDFRDQRMQKAEEQAAKIGTKLIFPLILCFFPAFFIVAIGPAIIAISKAFSEIV